MKKLLILGAGKSSSVLIKELCQKAKSEEWEITVADMTKEAVGMKLGAKGGATLMEIDLADHEQVNKTIQQADLVISMLPPFMHHVVAEMCVHAGKDMLTASYVSDEMRKLHELAKGKGVLLLNEMGVDPGIDHMSAMSVLNRISDEGGTITAFESFTGGLLAPESEKDNPWKYKFTWNPRNVVLAGQGTVKFKQEGKYKYIPYQRLFRRTEVIHIPEFGFFEGYANRDSLKYQEAYNLQQAKTIYRGTLRRPGFSRTWNAFVQLGATDDSFTINNSSELTYKEFINSFLYYNPTDSVELKLAHYMRWDIDSEEMHRMKWLGIFDDTPVGLDNATPAQILQKILEDKWTLDADDKDMIVMWHKFNYEMDGEPKELHASMVVVGDDRVETAMAKTVGLPIAIAAELVLKGEIDLSGVVIPTVKEVYQPVLRELGKYDVLFKETHVVDP